MAYGTVHDIACSNSQTCDLWFPVGSFQSPMDCEFMISVSLLSFLFAFLLLKYITLCGTNLHVWAYRCLYKHFMDSMSIWLLKQFQKTLENISEY